MQAERQLTSSFLYFPSRNQVLLSLVQEEHECPLGSSVHDTRNSERLWAACFGIVNFKPASDLLSVGCRASLCLTGGHCILRRHTYPRVEHQWESGSECQHLHRQEPADCVLLCVRDERMGHTERHRHWPFRWCGPGESLAADEAVWAAWPLQEQCHSTNPIGRSLSY